MPENKARNLAHSSALELRRREEYRADTKHGAIFNAIRDPAVIVNGAQRIEALNRAAEAVFGYPSEALIGKSLVLLFPSELAEAHEGCRLPAPCSCSLAPNSERLLAARRRDGTSFPTEVRLIPIPPEHERNAIAIIHDLSRESDLRAAKEAAEAANRSKSSFLTNMSHELRTPLNAIIGFAEILVSELHGPLGAPQYQGYAQDIRDSGDHLLQLINHILDLSRIEVGRYELRKERVIAAEIVKDVVRFVSLNAQQAGIDLVQEVGDPAIAAWIDRRAMRQVLLNLLSNAIKFTMRGGRVTISARRDGENLVLAVMDTGIGIPEGDLARLGRPFEQVANPLTRTHKGSGLGLAISKALVEAHEGKLSIASEPNVGTTVSATLPLNPDRA